MSSGKRLISGILGAILALGGVSAKRDRKRVSGSNSLSTGGKIAIGGAVLSLPTALLLWRLCGVDVEARRSDARAYVDRVLKGFPEHAKIIKSMVDGFVFDLDLGLGSLGMSAEMLALKEILVLSVAREENRLRFYFSFSVGEYKCSGKDCGGVVDISFNDDNVKTDHEEQVRGLLRKCAVFYFNEECKRQKLMDIEENKKNELIDKVVDCAFIACGMKVVDYLKNIFDKLGWY